MKFQKEFGYCFFGLFVLFAFFIISSFLNNLTLRLFVSVFNVILGSSMIVLGFWGSDFAFAMAAKQLNQSGVKGRFSGKKSEVYVPFMKNYTPLEWWNINWFITLVGATILAFGTLGLGLLF
jgi:hypothetical protein